jgi:mono/diheme cytochrome c family protein
MPTRLGIAVSASVVRGLVLLAGSSAVSAASSGADYESQVKSIFKKHCFACHGALKQEGNLRLDTVPSMLRGGDSGAAIAPGDAAASLIIKRVTSTDASERMPQEAEPLKADQIEAIKAWIAAGAKGPTDEKPEPDPREHWAFQKPVRPVADEGPIAGNSAIDGLIGAKHRELGLAPVGPASKHVQVRRLYLDLVGLPPSREELRSFLAEDAPDAFERTADRLLASPAYGERWARHWMDIWRYSDWYGRRSVPDVMNSYPQIWQWRDWIVRSLNADKGYDRMVMEMLAADEIAPEDEEALPATGFIARNFFKWNYDQWMKDQTEHTAKAFLGLTMNCALCHDHKYDPISQHEYFSLRAMFEPVEMRHDRVAGEPDPGPFKKYVYAQSYGPISSGRIRIFDEKLDAQTRIYRGGDQRQIIEGKPPVPPGVPAFLGGSFEVKQVNLPPRAWYPGLRPFVQQEEIAKRQAAIPVAESELAAARQALESQQPKLHELVVAAEKTLETARNESAQMPAVGALSGKQSLVLHAEQGRRALAHKIPALTSVDDKTVVRYIVQILKDAHTNFQLAIDIDTGATGGWIGFEGGKILSYKPATFEPIEIGKYDLAKGQNKFAVTLRLNPAAETMSAMVKSLSDGVVLVDAVPVTLKGWNGPRTDKQGIFLDARPGSVALYDDFVFGCRKDDGAIEPRFAFDFEDPAYPLGKEVAGTDGWVATGYCAAPATSLAGAPASMSPLVQAKEKELLVAKRSLEAVELAVKSSEAKLAAAQAELVSIQARVAADNCRHGFAAGNADELALAAAKAEGHAAVLTAQANLAASERGLAEAEGRPLADTMRDKLIADAQGKIAPAKKGIDDATAKAAKTDASYSPLSQVFPDKSTGRRTALANWVASQDNPLTARVAVNHLWGWHFGRPIVESTANFGRSGKLPSNQPLIDFLAVELMDGEWTMKRLHRKIVASDAYRRGAGVSPASSSNFAIDPDNRHLWRFSAQRLDAEIVRDSLLAVSGLLDRTFEGKEIEIADADKTRRRSLYLSHHGEAKMEFLDLFDGASATDCYVRTTSIRPQQALALANSELTLAQARALAKELAGPIAEMPSDAQDPAFIAAAFETILSRPPSQQETTVSLEFLTTQRQTLANAKVAEPISRSRESLVHALLNHNDFVTIR